MRSVRCGVTPPAASQQQPEAGEPGNGKTAVSHRPYVHGHGATDDTKPGTCRMVPVRLSIIRLYVHYNEGGWGLGGWGGMHRAAAGAHAYGPNELLKATGLRTPAHPSRPPACAPARSRSHREPPPPYPPSNHGAREVGGGSPSNGNSGVAARPAGMIRWARGRGGSVMRARTSSFNPADIHSFDGPGGATRGALPGVDAWLVRRRSSGRGCYKHVHVAYTLRTHCVRTAVLSVLPVAPPCVTLHLCCAVGSPALGRQAHRCRGIQVGGTDCWGGQGRGEGLSMQGRVCGADSSAFCITTTARPPPARFIGAGAPPPRNSACSCLCSLWRHWHVRVQGMCSVQLPCLTS